MERNNRKEAYEHLNPLVPPLVKFTLPLEMPYYNYAIMATSRKVLLTSFLWLVLFEKMEGKKNIWRLNRVDGYGGFT